MALICLLLKLEECLPVDESLLSETDYAVVTLAEAVVCPGSKLYLYLGEPSKLEHGKTSCVGWEFYVESCPCET